MLANLKTMLTQAANKPFVCTIYSIPIASSAQLMTTVELRA